MKYLSAIVVFGYLIPGASGLLFLGLGFTGWKIFSKERDVREHRLEVHQQDLELIQRLSANIAREAQWLEFVRTVVRGDQYTEVGEDVRKLEEDAGGLIRRTAYRRDGSGRTAISMPQPSEILELGFRGNFLAMQKLFVRLERSRPNLVLERLKVEPVPDKPGELSFDARYVALLRRATE